MIWSMKQNLNPAVTKVLKRLHYPLDEILLRALVRCLSAKSAPP
jgi:hypothetical protein